MRDPPEFGAHGRARNTSASVAILPCGVPKPIGGVCPWRFQVGSEVSWKAISKPFPGVTRSEQKRGLVGGAALAGGGGLWRLNLERVWKKKVQAWEELCVASDGKRKTRPRTKKDGPSGANLGRDLAAPKIRVLPRGEQLIVWSWRACFVVGFCGVLWRLFWQLW